MEYYNKIVGHIRTLTFNNSRYDGGMEYAMCTLILGEGTMEGLTGVIVITEMAHSYFNIFLQQ
jgi:hypothetical protein